MRRRSCAVPRRASVASDIACMIHPRDDSVVACDSVALVTQASQRPARAQEAELQRPTCHIFAAAFWRARVLAKTVRASIHFLMLAVLLALSDYPAWVETAGSGLARGDRGGTFVRAGPAFVLPHLAPPGLRQLRSTSGLCPLAAHRSAGFGGFKQSRAHPSALNATKTMAGSGIKKTSEPDIAGAPTRAAGSHDDTADDALSAQERRMLHFLSKFGKVHTATPADCTPTRSPRQTLRQQRDEMAKDRRDEKMSLRRRQDSATVTRTSNQCTKSHTDGQSADDKSSGRMPPMKPGRTRAAGRERSSSSSTRSPRAVQNYVTHVAVRTNGTLGSKAAASVRPAPQQPSSGGIREASPPVVKRALIPRRTADYTNLAELLDVLEPFCQAIGYGKSGGCGRAPEISASSVSDAVGALNRLKRLRPQARNRQMEARLSGCVDCLVTVVLDGMPLLSGKLVSLAINAVAHTRRHSRLISTAGERAMAIAESDDAKGLDVQAVSVILNGFARAGIRDVALFQSMSAVAIRLMDSEPDDFGAQAISVIANAFAKVRVADEELFTRLARCAERVPVRSYTPQAIANIMNAYARHKFLDVGLFSFLSTVARSSSPTDWLSRHLALVVNALAKLDYRDDELLAWIAQASLSRPPSSFDVQAIANILNGYSKMYGTSMDRQLLLHVAGELREIAHSSPRSLDPQSVASSLNALVKTGYQDLVSDGGADLLNQLSYVSSRIDSLAFDAQSVSTIMHAHAKLGLRDHRVFRRLAYVVGQMEFVLEPQSIALVINACAKVGYQDKQLMAHLSRIACSLPAETFSAQHVENILNGCARLDRRDRTLFLQMAEVVRALPVAEFDSQAVAIIMNSFARVMPQDAATASVFTHFSSQVLPTLASTDLQATSLSIILNAFAKAEICDHDAIARLCCMIVGEDSVLLQGGTGGIPVHDFDGRHIASVLHAIATLRVDQPETLAVLIDQLLTLAPEQLVPEEVAIIAWSVAVLHIQREDVHKWVMRGLDYHISSLDSNFRRQAHQFLLTCELDAEQEWQMSGSWRPPGDLGSKLKALRRLRKSIEVPMSGAAIDRQTERIAQERKRGSVKNSEGQMPRAGLSNVAAFDYRVSQHRPSLLQKDVALILSEMKIDFVEEYVDERSGYSLDMLLADKRTVIEVDGPSHYATGTHDPLGSTDMKHRHLAQLGFDLRVLPYWEWDQLKSKEQKMGYIRRLLTAMPTVNGH